jgi:hypothetical protein
LAYKSEAKRKNIRANKKRISKISSAMKEFKTSKLKQVSLDYRPCIASISMTPAIVKPLRLLKNSIISLSLDTNPVELKPRKVLNLLGNNLSSKTHRSGTHK